MYEPKAFVETFPGTSLQLGLEQQALFLIILDIQVSFYQRSYNQSNLKLLH
jgi:hypothetical protein